MSAAQPRPLGSRYELLDLLGTGAMGEVWRARDRETGDRLAAKVLRAEYARDTEIVTRFIQERSILTGLRHRNIVRVHDLVVEGDRLGILMELVEGGDLRDRLRARGTLPTREAVAATCSVLDALDAAHAQGCLHRDVKPDNVLLQGDLLDDAAVKLSDFSVARLAQESTVMATGLLGTPGYMPPELFVHGEFSAASDVYAAGVLLYELLAGRTPFAGTGTAHTIGNRHVTAEPPRIPVDDRLWGVLATMLGKDPRVRLAAAGTARALRDLPEEVLAGPALPVQRHPDSFGPADLTTAGRAPIRVRQPPAQLDPGVTNLHAGRATDLPVAGTGELRAFGAGGAVDDDDLTYVGRATPVHQAPVLTPGAVQEAEKPRRTWLRWVVGAVVLLGLVGGGVAFAQARDGDDPDEAATAGQVSTTSASQNDEPMATGLTVSREVEYDAASDQLRLRLRYTTQDAPLTGPFLQVIPAIDDSEQCPGVAWEGADQLPNIPRTTGISIPCGYAVELPQIPAQRSAEVTAVVDIDLGEDPEAVGAWLQRAADLTVEALTSESAQPTAYPVQRLADVRVAVQPGITTATRNVKVELLPVWVSGPDDTLTELFDSTSTTASTEVLQQIAGGLSGVKLDDACGGALSIQGGRKVSVLRPAEDCRIEAEVGNFDVESPPFTITGLGG